MATAGAPPPAKGLRSWKSLRPRSSILVKVVAGLVAALVVSGVSISMIGARLTRAASAQQARQLAEGQLSILEETYTERERQLLVSLRNLSQVLTFGGLTMPNRRHELIAELGRTAGNLGLDFLQVMDVDGTDPAPPAGTGDIIPVPGSVPQAISGEATSRLIPTTSGVWVQALATPLASPEGRALLVGGYTFDDAFAYRLRNRLGGLAEVTLVVAGQVVGTTLPSPPVLPLTARDGQLPESPAVVKFKGVNNVVAYVPVSQPLDGQPYGALGVTLPPDVVLTIDRTLVQARSATAIILALVTLVAGWLLFRGLVRPMMGLAGTARHIAAGEVHTSFDTTSRDEIGVLAEALEAMRLELSSRLALIARQAADLQESSERIVAAQDEERHRLARDLHDGIQQQLVVMRMQLGMLEDLRAPGGQGAGLVQRLGRDIDHAIEQLREVTQNLYPSILLDRGLAAALYSYVGRLPVSTALRCSPTEFPRLAPEIESAAYFLLCEAMTNSLKHADASRIELSLSLEDGWLVVDIADDGRGFQTGGECRGGGLQHMKDRVRSFGGDLTITSQLGCGTRIVATFPHRTEWDTSLWGSTVDLGR